MKDARGWLGENSVLVSLIDSVMAFGFQAFLKNTKRSVRPDEKRKADCYSLIALNLYGSVLGSPDTLLKLQVSSNLQLFRRFHANRLDNFGDGDYQTPF
jgi:hypothetical protein